MSDDERPSSRSGIIRAMKPVDPFSKIVAYIGGPLVLGGILGGLTLWKQVGLLEQRIATMPSATEVALLRQQLETVAASREKDISQDEKLRVQWRMHSWERARINAIEAHLSMPITAPPDER